MYPCTLEHTHTRTHTHKHTYTHTHTHAYTHMPTQAQTNIDMQSRFCKWFSFPFSVSVWVILSNSAVEEIMRIPEQDLSGRINYRGTISLSHIIGRIN